MRALAALAVSGVTVLSACSYEPSPDDLTQAEVDRIVDRCGASREKLQVNKGWLKMIAPREGDIANLCVVEEIKKTGKKRLSLVGNELHTTEEGK